MPIQVLLSKSGPLPLSITFNAISDAPVFLEVNGSVWTQQTNTMIGIDVAVDNRVVGTAKIFSNANATHRNVVPVYIQLELSQGQHSLVLSAAAGTSTVSDFNDQYTAVIHY